MTADERKLVIARVGIRGVIEHLNSVTTLRRGALYSRLRAIESLIAKDEEVKADVEALMDSIAREKTQ